MDKKCHLDCFLPGGPAAAKNGLYISALIFYTLCIKMHKLKNTLHDIMCL